MNKEMVIITAGVIGVVLIILGFVYMSFQMQSSMTWNWKYEKRAKALVCEMVKPEYLINPRDCR